MKNSVETMREGLQTASQAAAPKTTTFAADEIICDSMDGKPVYKLRGPEYRKFGVRIWPEVMPTLGIDPDLLLSGKNTLPFPIDVKVSMMQSKNDKTGEVRTVPHKVIGRA